MLRKAGLCLRGLPIAVLDRDTVLNLLDECVEENDVRRLGVMGSVVVRRTLRGWDEVLYIVSGEVGL